MPSSLRGITIGLFAFLPIQANAIVVSAGGSDYEISAISTSYTASTGLLMDQEWWGDRDLAVEFATALGDQLGATQNFGSYGPWFAHTDISGGLAAGSAYSAGYVGPSTGFWEADTYTFATAMVVDATVTIEVGGTYYDLSQITTSYSASTSLLMDQEWWGDRDLAVEFATALGDQLGSTDNFGSYGPWFAHTDISGNLAAGSAYSAGNVGPSTGFFEADTYTFVVANVSAAPPAVPEASGALLSLVGMTVLGLRRRRI